MGVFMSRLAPLDTTKLDAHQQAIYDAIASGPRKGVRGPLAVWLRHASLAEHAQALGRYCRYDTCLDPRLSELAILLLGRHWLAEYEWAAHKPFALEAGLALQVIDSIRDGVRPSFMKVDEELVYDFVTTLHTERNVDDDLYKRAVAVLGEDGVIDLTAVFGYHSLISVTIKVFDIPPHAGGAPELPTK